MLVSTFQQLLILNLNRYLSSLGGGKKTTIKSKFVICGSNSTNGTFLKKKSKVAYHALTFYNKHTVFAVPYLNFPGIEGCGNKCNRCSITLID